MSKDFNFLNENLVLFNTQVQSLSKLFKNEVCKGLSEQLASKFRSGKYNTQEQMKVTKLSKDFERIFKQYLEILESIRQKKIQQQVEIESKYNQAFQRRQTVQDQFRGRQETKINQPQQINEIQEEEVDDQQPNLQEVKEIESLNPEIELYGNLIQEKNNEIQQISTEANEVYKIMEDVAKLTFDQGKQLDVAEDNINQSNSNVKVAALELEDAQTEHKQYKKKMICAIITLLVIGVVVLLIIFA